MAWARHGRSSRRTISSPVRAVARQCTFRRSSPCRYSRVLTSSSPWTAIVRREPSPPPPCPPAGSAGTERLHAGDDEQRSRCRCRRRCARPARTDRPAAAAAGPARGGRGARRARGRRASPSRRRGAGRPRTAASGPRSAGTCSVRTQRPPGRVSALVTSRRTSADSPRGSRAGVRVRREASRNRSRATVSAEITGSARTKSASCTSARSPSSTPSSEQRRSAPDQAPAPGGQGREHEPGGHRISARVEPARRRAVP